MHATSTGPTIASDCSGRTVSERHCQPHRLVSAATHTAVTASTMETSSAPVTPQPYSSDASPTISQPLRQSHSYTQPSTTSASAQPLAAPSTAFASHFPTLTRPYPTVDSSAGLRALCVGSTALLSALSAPAVTEQLYSVHQTLQSSMARIDECAALTAAFRASNSQLNSDTLPLLLSAAHTTLPALYSRIDALTAYTAALEQSVEGLEAALTTAEAALASQRPVSLNKLLSSLKRRARDDQASSEQWTAVTALQAKDFFDLSHTLPPAIPQP